MKKVRSESETPRDYARRKAKENYDNDPEYKAKMCLKCWKKKYTDNKDYQNIFSSKSLLNTEKLKQAKKYHLQIKLNDLN